MPFPTLWVSQFEVLDGQIPMHAVPYIKHGLSTVFMKTLLQSRAIAEGYPDGMSVDYITNSVHFPTAKVHTKPSPVTR